MTDFAIALEYTVNGIDTVSELDADHAVLTASRSIDYATVDRCPLARCAGSACYRVTVYAETDYDTATAVYDEHGYGSVTDAITAELWAVSL